MKGRLAIELDNDAITKDRIKLVLGGFAIVKKRDENGKIESLLPVKILGLYKDILDGYDISNGTNVIVKVKNATPGKITIDGYDVAKEDYRVFVGALNNEYEYTLNNFNTKPVSGETATVVDLRLLDSPIFSNITNRDVIISKFNNSTKRYEGIMANNKHISLKRHQFTLENNIIQIAFLKGLNSEYL